MFYHVCLMLLLGIVILIEVKNRKRSFLDINKTYGRFERSVQNIFSRYEVKIFC